MSLLAAVYDALQAQVYAADTGTGGLNKSDSAAYVREWIRIGSPSYVPDRTGARPTVMTEVLDSPDHSFSNYGTLLTVRFHVVTIRDIAFTDATAILARLYTRTQGVTLTDPNGTGWTFNPMQWQRDGLETQTPSQLYHVCEVALIADK